MSKIIDALLCDIDKNIKHIQDKIHIYGKIKDNYDKIDGREYDKFMQNFKHPFYITIIDNGRVINVDEDDECDSIYVLRTIRKCGLSQRKTKMVATSQKCVPHF